MKHATSLLAVLSLAVSAGAAPVYLKAGATGACNGTSWTDAYTNVAVAIRAAEAGDGLLYVARGVYVLTNTFVIASPLSIYGGFAGASMDETPASRDTAANQTVFSGDFGGGSAVGGDNAKVLQYAGKAVSASRMDNVTVLVLMNTSKTGGTCYMNDPEDSSIYAGGSSVVWVPYNDANYKCRTYDASLVADVLRNPDNGAGATLDEDLLTTRGNEHYGEYSPTAIKGVKAVDDAQVVGIRYYNLNGAQLTAPQKGVNILEFQMSDGTTRTNKIYK